MYRTLLARCEYTEFALIGFILLCTISTILTPCKQGAVHFLAMRTQYSRRKLRASKVRYISFQRNLQLYLAQGAVRFLAMSPDGEQN